MLVTGVEEGGGSCTLLCVGDFVIFRLFHSALRPTISAVLITNNPIRWITKERAIVSPRNFIEFCVMDCALRINFNEHRCHIFGSSAHVHTQADISIICILYIIFS